MTPALLLARGGHLRGLGAGDPARRSKEWLHVAVHGPTAEIVLNLNVFEDGDPWLPPGVPVGRTLWLAAVDGAVRGDVHRGARVEAKEGHLSLAIDGDAITLADGALRVRAARPGFAVDLRLVPAVRPALAPRIPFDTADRVQWFLVPRLHATGTATIDGVVHAFADSPAYHDHNWGRFAWGADFAWEWGYLLPEAPEEPVCLVFARLLDRRQHRVRSAGCFVWWGADNVRSFQDAEVGFAPTGRFTGPLPPVPGVMGLISPDRRADVPARLQVTAAGSGDAVSVDFTPARGGRILIPDESDPFGVTALHEVFGAGRADGEIGGRRFSFAGRGAFECIRVG